MRCTYSTSLMEEEKGTTEDEMVGWHHRINGHEFGQTPGHGEEQGSLACCSPWSHKESDMIEQQYICNGILLLLLLLSRFSRVQLCATP